MNTLPEVSIVVIGLNEAKNLHNTFKSINRIDYPKEKLEIIYCDTGSKDRSIDIARQYTEKIFVEKSIWPTPGLARNRGIIESTYDIIHFIDGDIQISKDYLKKAVEKLMEVNIHAVYGYLEEESNSMVNITLIDHWKRKKCGPSSSTGGGGTYKKKLLLEINGYDERLKRGEEIELGTRFKEKGLNIWLMNTQMGVHSYDELNLFGLLKRHLINGQSMGFVAMLPEKSNYMKEILGKVIRYIFYSLIFMIIFFIFLVIKPFTSVLFIFLILLILHLYYVVKFFKLIIERRKYQLIENYFMFLSFPLRILGILYSFFRILFLQLTRHKVLKRKMKLTNFLSDL
jgi:glycosyltransferase involved in cell wall biosynthesis